MKKAIVVVVGVMGFAGSATAQAPVAVVEEVQGNVTGAEFMDYVVPGKVIKLGQGASIVVGYMKSCRRETINGVGTVIVGEDESKVHLAEIEATRTNCDPAQSHATTRATSDVAASVVRGVGKDAAPGSAQPAGPQLTLYGTSPLVEAKGRGTLVFERLDQKGERQQVEVKDPSFGRRGPVVARDGFAVIAFRFVDFAPFGDQNQHRQRDREDRQVGQTGEADRDEEADQQQHRGEVYGARGLAPAEHLGDEGCDRVHRWRRGCRVSDPLRFDHYDCGPCEVFGRHHRCG